MASSKVQRPSAKQTPPGERESSNQMNARAMASYLMHFLLTGIELPFRYLFGRDIFISYSRSDASKYAPSLALALQAKRPKLSFYLDRWIAPPSGELPHSLKRHLRWSSILVVVCTENAIKSKFVKDELSSFSKLGRKVIPVDVDGAFHSVDPEQSPWNEISGASWEEESREAVASGHPSENVIERILKSVEFTNQDRRLRRAVWSTLAFVILSVGGALLFSSFTIKKANAKADEAVRTAKDANIAAGEANQRAQAADHNAALADIRATNSNAKADLAESRASTAENKAIDEELKARNASVRAERANRLRERAEARAVLAQRKEAEALERAEIAAEQEKGSSVALIARQAGREFEAVRVAAKVAASNFTRPEPDAQVVGGLVVSVMATDYTVPLNIERRGRGPVQISPDGSMLFVQSLRPDNSPQWELFNLRQPAAPLVLEEGSFASYVTFSRDGKRLVVVGGRKSQEVKLWDLSNTPSILRTWAGLRYVALDNTGERIAMMEVRDQNITVENLRTRESERHPVEKGLSVRAIAFSPSGEIVLQAAQKTSPSSLHKLVAYSPSRKGVVFGEISPRVMMAGVSDDGSIILTSPRTVFRVDIETGHQKQVATGYKGAVTSVTLGKEPRVILSGRGGLSITDNQEHPNFYALRGHDRKISNIAFSPDGKLIATSSESRLTLNRINIWQSGTGRLLKVLRGSQVPRVFAFSRDSSRLAAIGQGVDRSVKIWNINSTGKDGASFCGANNINGLGFPLATSFLHDDRYVASAHMEGLLVIWDASNCMPVRVVNLDYERQWQINGAKFERNDFEKAMFAANGATLITEHVVRDYANNQFKTDVHLWDLNAIDLSEAYLNDGKSPLDNRTPLSSKFPPISNPPGWLIAVKPRGEIQLLFRNQSGELQITGTDGSTTLKLAGGLITHNANFSHDGQRVLAGGDNNERIVIWDANNGQQVLDIWNAAIIFTKAVIAPDGESFAICGADGAVRVYPTTAKGFLDVASNLTRRASK